MRFLSFRSLSQHSLSHWLLITVGLALVVLAPSYAEPSAQTSPITLQTDALKLEISPQGGGLQKALLLERQFLRKGAQPVNLVTTDKPQFLPLKITVEGAKVPDDALWTVRKAEGQNVVLSFVGDGLEITRSFTAGNGPYQILVDTQVRNLGKTSRTLQVRTQTHHYVTQEQQKSSFFASRSPAQSFGLCHHNGKLERLEGEALLRRHNYSKSVAFAAIENVYFTIAMVPQNSAPVRCTLKTSYRGGSAEDPQGSLFLATLDYPKTTIAPQGTKTFSTLAFIGPKKPEALRRAGHHLESVVDLGFFSVLAGALVDLLEFIHRGVGNWGLAIILLTLLAKLVLYPLTEKSFKSMARLRQLKPEMDRINELYKDEREKKGAAMMELYRRYKINPMGGCLPQLLQLPIWWALYTSLSTNIELYNAPFFGFWSDLAAPDPYFVLPLMLGGLMFVQQKLTPSTMDPAQARMMLYVMPAFLTFVMHFLPSGLCLYMVTNSALSLMQQKFIEMRLAAKPLDSESLQSGQTDGPIDPAKPQASANKPITHARNGQKGASRALSRRTRRERA